MSTQPVRARTQGEPRRSSLPPDELEAVYRAARSVARAAKAEDVERRVARFADLQSVLAEVRQRRGDHPTLWELEADFASDPAVAADLYMRAEKAASDAGMPTLSVRLSLARLLVRELGYHREARAALLACADELPEASEKECAAWGELLTACEQRLGSSAP
jgi:hypothetical protein